MLAFMPPPSLRAVAQEPPQLKPDTPRIDTRAVPAEPGGGEKPKTPLQGKVQKTEKGGGLSGSASGGQSGGWGRGRADIRRKATGSVKQDNLSAQVESGIGIIGVKFVLFAGRPPVINRVFPQTPAQEVGLRQNDVILAVDGVPTVGLTKEEVYDMIVGTPGTTVTLSINRDGDYMAVTMRRMDLNDITDPFVRRDYMMSM